MAAVSSTSIGSQLDPEVVLHSALTASGSDSFDAFVPADLVIEGVEALKVGAVFSLPGAAGLHVGGEFGALALEVDELVVVAKNLGLEGGDAPFELAALRAMGASTDRA